MKQEEEQPIEIPEFLKAYYDGSDFEGQAKLEVIAQRYAIERQKFASGPFVQRQQLQHLYNRTTGQNKSLDLEEELTPTKQRFTDEAKVTAAQHGYTEQEENAIKGADEKLRPESKADTNASVEREPLAPTDQEHHDETSQQEEREEQVKEPTQSEAEKQRAAFAKQLQDLRLRQQKKKVAQPTHEDVDETAVEADPEEIEQTPVQIFKANLETIRTKQKNLIPKH